MKRYPPKWYFLPALTAAVIAGVSIYYIITAYIVFEAKNDVRDLLLSHRGLHQYIQRVMHPAFYRARDNGDIKLNYYDPAILSSSYIVRVTNIFHNEERKRLGQPEIYYKMAANNPRNPANKADLTESRLISMFNKNRNLHEYQKVIDKDGKKYLLYAIPFLETTEACLVCHGERSNAPAGLQSIYKGDGGFNEKCGKIRAVESIMVPINQRLTGGYVIAGSFSTGILMIMMLVFFNRKLHASIDEKTREISKEVETRKKNEDTIANTLQEKEILLKEIHHRVKNNMAIITSIMDMKALTLPEESTKKIFRDCQQRIITMAVVHEKLYNSDNLKSVSIRNYLADLTGSIAAAYSESGKEIRISAEIEDISLPIDILIPLGLITNEITVNSFKYAFSGTDDPEIVLTLKRENGNISYSVSDNGCGLPENAGSSRTTIGIDLIRILIRQIKGELRISGGSGTRYDITFPE